MKTRFCLMYVVRIIVFKRIILPASCFLRVQKGQNKVKLYFENVGAFGLNSQILLVLQTCVVLWLKSTKYFFTKYLQKCYSKAQN